MPPSILLKSKNESKKEVFVVCQNLRSLFNVGAIFRTADAFAIDKIYLAGITGQPPRSEISKVALGAEEYIPWEYHKQPLRLIKSLKSKGIKIVALEQVKDRSINLNTWKPTYPMALVLGYEPTGLPKAIIDIADLIVEIPMHGQKESLNVGVAFGIAANHISISKNSHFS
ncbi:MAG: RNA methyltransferase [Candidatus Doudnabacteria bacterium]